MTKSDSVPCPFCGARNPLPLSSQRCLSCGAKLGPSMPPSRQEEIERRYRQHGFSGLWCAISIGIVAIMTGSLIVGLPMVVPIFDFEGSAGMMLAIPIWFVSGILVGLVSPGRTILEPSVATFLVAMPTAFLLFREQTVKTLPGFMYVLLSALGILFATIGAYLGERLQLGPTARKELEN
jgi:hypothetical protein